MGISSHAVGIVGVGSAIPQGILTNKELETMVETSDEWIQTRTGIKERRIAAPGETTSVLAIKAAQKALEDAGVSSEQIDLIVVATATPDMIFPSTACLVQEAIGAKSSAAYDLTAGCSGFIYALSQAASSIAAGLSRCALVIGAETLSNITDWNDRNTCVLFGDGAGAVVLQRVEEGYGLQSFFLGADGSGGSYLTLPGGGSSSPASVATVANRLHYIKMSGNEVFKFAVRIMGDASLEALQRAGLTKECIDLFLPHQANIRIIEAAARRLDLSMDKVLVNVDRFGNTSAASIPLALVEAYEQNRLRKGSNLLMVGFGAGLTWGATVLRWSKEAS